MSTATLAPSGSRLRAYASFVRFEHTLFSLPLILAGVFSAAGPPLGAARWLLLTAAAVGARTAAMALNRIVDRRLDARNPRTSTRELPSGRMRLWEAVGLLLASSAAYVGACAGLGPWFLRVSPVPLAVFALYPWLKRFTPFCHFGVGLALALAPLAGYAAAHPDLHAPAAALWLAVFAFTWVSGFDIIYATLDEASDRREGVHSMVVRLGRARALQLSAVLHVIAMAALVVAAFTVLGAGARPGAIAGVIALLGVAGVLLHLEQRWAEDVNLAFFKTNVWVGAVVLAVVLVARIGRAGG